MDGREGRGGGGGGGGGVEVTLKHRGVYVDAS